MDSGLNSVFYGIALFNTMLGMMNFDKNERQHKEQEEIQHKLDLILSKLSDMEGENIGGTE